MEPTTATRTTRRPLLGEQLLEAGRITRQQLDAALALMRKRSLKIGQALVEQGALTEAELSDALRRQGKVLCVRLSSDLVDAPTAKRLDERDARRLPAIVLNSIAGICTVAMADPGDLCKVDEVSTLLKSPVLPVYADPEAIKATIEAVYAGATREKLDAISTKLDDEPVDFEVAVPGGEEDATDASLDAPVVNLVRGLVQEAYELRASDIHLESRRNAFVVRFRVDGSLYDRLVLDKKWARPAIARVKVLASVDLTQSRLPQDGRAQANINGRVIDLRVATTPTLHGESAVIRVLDGGREIAGLEDLGLDQRQREALDAMMEAGDGFVLATGPTGSGKTTTLYALLKQIHTPDTKIVTLEDPVENQIEGITQIPINPKAGLTFAKGLRSVLRQDPDVVLLGEIRDEETARIAVASALTGHLVLSTVHTVGTVETITRLSDMGIESYLLADVLRGVVAQRLVRKICPVCRQPAATDPAALGRLGLDPAEVQPMEGRGCDDCHGTGHKGRMALREVLLFTPAITSMVQRGERSELIRDAARAAGMTTLREEAILRVKEGVISLKEALGATSRV